MKLIERKAPDEKYLVLLEKAPPATVHMLLHLEAMIEVAEPLPEATYVGAEFIEVAVTLTPLVDMRTEAHA
ncbi:MAG TPA: hypothetical protein VJ183_11820 [Chloroflexia bacterium]|nr:hypothetical protein [Chloroflexia bacterium]